MTVNDTTRNAGTSTVGTSTTRIWLSVDKTLGSDLELGARFLPALTAGAHHTGSTVVTVPSVTPGKYYLIAQADADGEVSESSETDNVRAKALVIGPDLTIQALTFSPSSPSSTTPTTITIAVKNGGGPAGASVTRIYRSANGKLDASDTLLAEVPLSGLDAATVATQTATVSLPAGTYYVIAVCDAAGALSEANEGNNLKKVLKTVTP
jgi:subtilase family serine protease